MRANYLLPLGVGFGVLCLSLLSLSHSQAELIALSPVDVATATDNGPQDGIFDDFAPINLGSVNNNGYTSFSTALEFDLAALPPGAKINAAALTMSVNWVEGTRSLALDGYAGDGKVSLADFSSNAPIANITLLPPGSETILFDSADFIQNLATNAVRYVGFNLREAPANTVNYTVLFFNASGARGPQLTIDFEPATNPNPDSDADGVPDAIDQCPDTPAGSVVSPEGCSIQQLVPCDRPRSGGPWKNHGDYVSAVTRTALAFVHAQLITRAEAAQIIRAAAQSDCGKICRPVRPPF